MGRPHGKYRIRHRLHHGYFRPEFCDPTECVRITPAEIEALRLKNIKDLDQTEAAKKMGISQSTFQRILSSAYKKVSRALIEGRELRIVKD